MSVTAQVSVQSFKECTLCGIRWANCRQFLTDPFIELIGYQCNFDALKKGLFYFNHTAEDCRTTLCIETGSFLDIFQGVIYTNRSTGSESCPGYCLDTAELRPCPEPCECAHIREIIQLIIEESSLK